MKTRILGLLLLLSSATAKAEYNVPLYDSYSGRLMGYVSNAPTEAANLYFLCYMSVNNRNFIGTAEECQRPGNKIRRAIGYLPINPEKGRRALYRCHRQEDLVSFVSFDSYCEGWSTDYMMGYLPTCSQ